MAQTKIKAAQFSGVIGNGTDGYILQSSGNGDMEWVANVVNPTVLSVAYPGDDTAADPTGGQTVTITGTGFQTGANVTIGGTAATSVSFVSATTLTITTPAKAAGDYDIVVTNTDTGIGTKINGISYNGVPAWTTAAGSLGTFASDTTISTITLQASEPDAGTITFDIISGTLPTGLSLTGANINGTTSLENADTLYNFTIEAIDDENQATPRAFSITVTKQFISTDNFTINTYTGNGSTQSIEGKIGTAAVFNGLQTSSASYVDISSSTTSTTSTVSFWMNTTIKDSNAGTMLDAGGGSSANTGFSIVRTATNGYLSVNFTHGTAGQNQTFTGTTDICDGTWHHICLVMKSDNTFICYLDGASHLSGTRTYWTSGDSHNLSNNRLGTNAGSVGASSYGGKIDQVRIFDKALSSSEVTTLYGEPSNPSTASKTDIFNDGSGVALYEFEEGGKDTGGVTGYIGSGGIFNGSSSIIKSASLGTQFREQTNLSISAWFNTSATTGRMTIVSFSATGDPSTDLFLGIDSSVNTVGFRNLANGTSLQAENITGTSVRDGNWHHVVFTADSNGNKLYVDGSQITVNYDSGSSSSTIVMPSNLNQFHIGGNEDSGGDQWFWNGKIDQVRIFDKALSSSEVTTLYQETSASATKSTTDIFDDGSGIALYELEGNANDTGPETGYSIDGSIRSLLNGDYFDTTVNQVTTHSISFWAKIPTTTGASRSISTTTNSSGDVGYIFRTGSNNNELQFMDIQGGATNNSSTWSSIESNQWKHFVIVLDSTEARIYENTVLKATVSAANVTLQNGGNIRFGAGLYYGSDAYLEYKHIRTYLRALNTTEINTLYNENFTNLNVISSPQSWFNFDNNSSGSVNDKTGSYTGTISGMTYTAPSNYDGTATNVSYAYDGTPTNVSFVGTSFQPDLIWIKVRNAAFNNMLTDSIGGNNTFLISNQTAVLDTNSSAPSFDTNGFTLGGFNNNWNNSGYNYAAWCWKAANTTTTIAANTVGNTIASDVRANQAAGFSIVKYTGTGANATVGHGLNSAPEMVIVKGLTTTYDWVVYHTALTNASYYLTLNSTNAQNSASAVWNSTAPSSTNISLGSNLAVNSNNVSHIAYCFHSVDGYQKVGSYTGTGASGNSITTGFQPRWLLVKRTNTADNWVIVDSIRGVNGSLFPDDTSQELSNSGAVTFNSNGFTVNGASGGWNNGTSTYIYLAIA